MQYWGRQKVETDHPEAQDTHLFIRRMLVQRHKLDMMSNKPTYLHHEVDRARCFLGREWNRSANRERGAERKRGDRDI